jgi:hypothetical protein
MRKCKKCDYPIFSYSRCCPMCGRAVEIVSGKGQHAQTPLTRLDLWLAGFRRTAEPSKTRRPMSA